MKLKIIYTILFSVLITAKEKAVATKEKAAATKEKAAATKEKAAVAAMETTPPPLGGGARRFESGRLVG